MCLSHQVTEESCRAQFLVPVTEHGRNRARASLERAQNLNPMVEVLADTDRIEDKPDTFFLQFNAVSAHYVVGFIVKQFEIKTTGWMDR